MAKIKLTKNTEQKLNRIFIADDGSWGDAAGLEILELTDEQLSELNEATENEQLDYLSGIPDEQSLLFIEAN